MRLKCERLFVALLLLLTAGWQVSWATGEKGMLWKVEGAGKRPSYLLGTIHSGDPRVLRLPAVTQKAFVGADSFSGEVEMDMNSMLQVSESMFYSDGSMLKDKLDPKLYQQTVSLLAGYGLPEMIVQRMKPWAVATTLSLPKNSSGQVLDMQLYNDATMQGKRVYGLETVQEQISALNGMSERLQVEMVRSAVQQHPELDRINARLINAYLKQDLVALERISEETLSKEDHSVAEAFTSEVVNKRNIRMLSRMQPRLREGNAFIAVGALHLPGKKGLLNLLRRKGYTVTPVY
ncbi:MAG: TraB/GumN family protein [Proteobacteria bacterium]|jgi:hypothetical protein|nr:TraB/GumN family protein [Pseudomonadota bacterium]